MTLTSNPFVSVIMSVFNEENYLQDAIESILNQTFRDFEFIIIDDYSTDRSFELCQKYANNDPRIRVYPKRTEPRHLAASRNIGINMAKGDYIVLQDADDVSRHDRIEIQLAYARRNPGKRVVGCWVDRIEGGKSRIMRPPGNHSKIIQGFMRGYNRTTIVPGTILASKPVFTSYPYRIQFKYMQDWDHMLRMYESGQVEFYNCQESLYTYFIRKKGVMFNPEWLDYNIFVRHCQMRRKKGLSEFGTLDKFHEHLARHPLERIKWGVIKNMISANLKLGRIKDSIRHDT